MAAYVFLSFAGKAFSDGELLWNRMDSTDKMPAESQHESGAELCDFALGGPLLAY